MDLKRSQIPPNKMVYEEPKVEIISTDNIDIIMNSNMAEWDRPLSLNRTFNF